MILEMDVGNSRIKWRTLLNGTICKRGAFEKEDAERWLNSQGVNFKPNKVRVSCVGDRAIMSRIKEVSELWSSVYQEAFTSHSVAGVECGYLDPSALGVDRWLAIVAAYKKSEKACVVVDMGTAITVDIINEFGVHLGGYIVPGLSMMNESLYRGTRKVKVDTHVIDDTAPGRATDLAVANGCLLMVQAMVNSAFDDISAHSDSPELFVTGGDGNKLMTVLDRGATYLPDLVMDGLQYVVP